MKIVSLQALCVSLLFSFSAFSCGPIPFHGIEDIVDSIAKHGIDESYAHQPKVKRYVAPAAVSDSSKKHKAFYPERLATLDAAVDNFVSSGLVPSAFSIAFARGECHSRYAGVENVETQKPFTGNTIIRLASQSKFLGTVGFLKLIDKGIITGFEPLSDFIPEFAHTKVLVPGSEISTITLTDAISANGTTTLTFTDSTVRVSGDWVGIRNASDVLGIQANQINGLRRVTAVNPGIDFSIVVETAASASGSGLGGVIEVQTLTQPLARPITLYHVMTHTLGYSYSSTAGLGSPFGFASDPFLLNEQNRIYNSLLLPMAAPNPALPLSSRGIQEWARVLAQVPVLFQPGTNWSYGPTLSILGAVIEVIEARRATNRNLETYMQEEVLKPLDMQSTGFFIQNNAPDRAEKLARIQTLYFVAAPNVFIPISVIPGSEYFEDYFYGLEQPKTLAFIDGGMYSTPNDYLKFMRMFLNDGFAKSGESILSPAMLVWLSENHTLENSIYNLYPGIGKLPKWGLGVGIQTGVTVSGVVGASERAISWGGAAGTKYQIDFGNSIVAMVGTNILSSPNIQDPFESALLRLNWSALKSVYPNNENASGNNPESAANPT